MPTVPKENLEAMLTFLDTLGHPLPEHSQTKSASIESIFEHKPLVKSLIRITRKETLKQVLLEFHLGLNRFYR